MSVDDYFATIVAVESAWTLAYKLLCKYVNAFLDRGAAELPVVQVSALKTAIGNLRVAIHRLQGFQHIPADFPWLIIGALPVSSLDEVKYQLRHVSNASAKAGFTLQFETVLPKEQAEKIRAMLTTERIRATQSSLSDPERKALRGLYMLKAFSQETRQSIPNVARQAEKKKWANAGPYRTAIPCLVRKGLVKTKEGRGGGPWLTADGRKIAKTIRLK